MGCHSSVLLLGQVFKLQLTTCNLFQDNMHLQNDEQEHHGTLLPSKSVFAVYMRRLCILQVAAAACLQTTHCVL